MSFPTNRKEAAPDQEQKALTSSCRCGPLVTLSTLRRLCLNVSSCYSNEKSVALMTHIMQILMVKLNFE